MLKLSEQGKYVPLHRLQKLSLPKSAANLEMQLADEFVQQHEVSNMHRLMYIA